MMRKTERKQYLRWLLPVLVLYVILATILVLYKSEYEKKIVKAKEAEIAIAMGDEVKEVDMSLQKALSYMEASSKAMSLYALEYNKNQILPIIKSVSDNTDILQVMICDLSGDGYDELGETIAIGSEPYFEEILSEYSRGGIGMVLSGEITEDNDTEAMLVSSVSFDKKEKGFMVARFPIVPISERLFIVRYIADRVAIVTLDGTILNSGRSQSSGEKSFWDILPIGLSRDTLKLSISQKNTYMSEVPDYGYVLVVPMDVATGGAVALITYDQMKVMIKDDMGAYWGLVFRIAIASVVVAVLIILANLLGNIIQEKMRMRTLSVVETDPVTGLLTRSSAEKEIYNYIENEEDGGGLMFIIGIEGVHPETNLDNTKADAGRKSFAKHLSKSFRATDVLARIGEDRYLVFMKGIKEEKSIRKQTDEMQLFLHDLDVHDAEDNVEAYVGASLYPKNGRNVGELIKAAENAYNRSKGAGAGRLSF